MSVRRGVIDILPYLSLVGIAMLLAPEERWTVGYLSVSFVLMLLGGLALLLIANKRPKIVIVGTAARTQAPQSR